jgi:hypothetical protein
MQGGGDRKASHEMKVLYDCLAKRLIKCFSGTHP